MVEEITDMLIENLVETNDDFKNIDKEHLKEILIASTRQNMPKRRTLEEINEARKIYSEIIAEENERTNKEFVDKFLKFIIENDTSDTFKNADKVQLMKERLIASVNDGTIFRDSTA